MQGKAADNRSSYIRFARNEEVARIQRKASEPTATEAKAAGQHSMAFNTAQPKVPIDHAGGMQFGGNSFLNDIMRANDHILYVFAAGALSMWILIKYKYS